MAAQPSLTTVLTDPPDSHQERQFPSAASPQITNRVLGLVRTVINFGRLYIPVSFKSAPPPLAATPTNTPAPHQERQSPSADSLRSTGRLLSLVRSLIDFGKQLATTLQQRTSATDLTEIIRNFGTRDIALILARITHGLHLAAALETRLASRRERQPTAPANLTAPSRRQPRVAQSADRNATDATADPHLTRLPTPEDIAAEVRRRPIGAVIADICRDLAIVPGNPLWGEISHAIAAHGGSYASLVKDMIHRVIMRPEDQPATEHPEGSPLDLSFAVTPGTGPP
jgi:hypothetical protein